ncbi:hypothetical protein H8923_01880 [Romboutsia hominis]|uniref:Uncharacterized protein n=1 Tax=Romboutsia faecis TaxID=2764597 RepID=A0ABR7JLC1_9FIRM|nr:hypothetical protein [Romboutsia faecis]MBC5995498.1 hypothetical protein [Romboutsia faecis]
MLSKIKINNELESYESLALAPVSVIEELQGKGIKWSCRIFNSVFIV